MPAPRGAWWPAPGGTYSPHCQCPIQPCYPFLELSAVPLRDALVWLAQPDPGVREAALEALKRRRWVPAGQRSGTAETGDLDARVTALLADPDPRVRRAAERLGRADLHDRPVAAPAGLGEDDTDAEGRRVLVRRSTSVLDQEARRHDPDQVARRAESSRNFLADMAWSDWLADEVRQTMRAQRHAADTSFHDGPGAHALAEAERVLLRLVADPFCSLRYDLVTQLYGSVPRAALPRLAPALEARLGAEPCRATAGKLALLLASWHDSPRSVDAALDILRRGDVVERGWLAHVTPPELEAVLLRDADPEVRSSAALRGAASFEAPTPWRDGIDIEPVEHSPAEVVAEFDALWGAVLPQRDRAPADAGRWTAWPNTIENVEPWLLDLLGHRETSPTVRFRVLEELLVDLAPTPSHGLLLGTAGAALVTEAVDADWFEDVWEPWLRVVALFPAWSWDEDDERNRTVGDPDVAVRLCWTPPRALPVERHVEFWRRSGAVLWRAAFRQPRTSGEQNDPRWRARLTSLGLTAELALAQGDVPDALRPALDRVALYAPDAPLAVVAGVPRCRRPGDPPPAMVVD